jgi:hypothetical protein
MPKYEVTIRATVTKTLTVEEDCDANAITAAHEIFSVLCDGDEDYKEETLSVEEVK